MNDHVFSWLSIMPGARWLPCRLWEQRESDTHLGSALFIWSESEQTVSPSAHSPIASKRQGLYNMPVTSFSKGRRELSWWGVIALSKLLPSVRLHQNQSPSVICCENQIPERIPYASSKNLFVNCEDFSSRRRGWSCKNPNDFSLFFI